jgi:Transposase IS116/IS110/IS902 family
VAERFPEPAMPKSIEVDLALIDYCDERLTDLALPIVHTATHHDAHTLYCLQSIPGMGNIVALVRPYAMHAIRRFPSVQDFAS